MFIGPPASAIDAMGSKTRARELMQAAGVPIVPGTVEAVADARGRREDHRRRDRLPGRRQGGGRRRRQGLSRRARSPTELQAAFEGAAREGEKFFSDATVYLERYLPDPRHVEVQVLADGHGNTIHLGERDCSIQRRHQKLIEESPAPEWIVDEALRERIGTIAVEAARAVDYRGAGHGRGAAGRGDHEYFFLEMNTRVQVEHCVTEMTTGIDIVKAGIRVAAGEALSFTQDDVVLRGHAIECRINAEDASRKFAPAPGRIGAYVEPSGPGVRVDSGVRAGSEISPMYDPMVAKLIVWDADREQATARMLRALAEYEIEGLKTLIPFHRALLATEQWANGETCRDLLEDAAWLKALAFDKPPRRKPSDDDDEETVEQTYTVEVSGRKFDVRVIGPPAAPARRRRPTARAARAEASHACGARAARGLQRPRRRHARLADAGQRVEGPGARRPGGRRGRDRDDHRGDEDGERDHRAQGRRHRRAADLRGRRGAQRRRARGHPRRHLSICGAGARRGAGRRGDSGGRVRFGALANSIIERPALECCGVRPGV